MIQKYDKKAKIGMGIGFVLLIVFGGLIGENENPPSHIMAIGMIAYAVFVWGGFMLVKAKKQPTFYGIAAMSVIGALLLLILKDKSEEQAEKQETC